MYYVAAVEDRELSVLLNFFASVHDGNPDLSIEETKAALRLAIERGYGEDETGLYQMFAETFDEPVA